MNFATGLKETNQATRLSNFGRLAYATRFNYAYDNKYLVELSVRADANNNFAGRIDLTNNVVYNWGSRTTDGGAKEVNFVGNYYKPGPGIELTQYALNMDHEDNFAGMQRAYFSGNVMPGFFVVITPRKAVPRKASKNRAYHYICKRGFFQGI